MQLPTEATTAPEKLTDYLLTKRMRNDKSKFLARAGYTTANADRLEGDLRTQILPREATPGRDSKFGKFYEIDGPLTGPNGTTLQIKTIWMTEHLSGATKFITVIPQA